MFADIAYLLSKGWYSRVVGQALTQLRKSVEELALPYNKRSNLLTQIDNLIDYVEECPPELVNSSTTSALLNCIAEVYAMLHKPQMLEERLAYRLLFLNQLGVTSVSLEKFKLMVIANDSSKINNLLRYACVDRVEVNPQVDFAYDEWEVIK